MDEEIWGKLEENASYLATHIHLPTLLANLRRRGVIGTEDSDRILSLTDGSQITTLIALLREKLAGKAKTMCDAIQETNPEVLEKVDIILKDESSKFKVINLFLKFKQKLCKI